MKYKLIFLLLLASLTYGCMEMPITIPSGTIDPGTGPDQRKVLVEELTGVRCPNCPDGTASLVALGDQLGENLIVVSIHAAPGYDQPYPESQYDFRTSDGSILSNYIGLPSFFPTAAINRRIVPPETEPYLPRQMWAGIIDEDLGEDPAMSIELEKNYDAISRKLNLTVTMTPRAALSGEHRLTLLITQDSIQDVQKKGLEKIPDYYHRHVLRDVITQATGDVISEPLVVNNAVEKKYSITLPVEWNEKHCSVVAFVHHGSAPDKEVLQAVEIHVTD